MNVESISDELVSPFSFKKQFFINFNTGNIQDFYDLEKSKAYFNIYIFCYLINQTIGEGAYGRVVKALRKNKDQFRAIKIIAKSKVSDPEKFKNEIEILRTLVLSFLLLNLNYNNNNLFCRTILTL